MSGAICVHNSPKVPLHLDLDCGVTWRLQILLQTPRFLVEQMELRPAMPKEVLVQSWHTSCGLRICFKLPECLMPSYAVTELMQHVATQVQAP